MAAELQQEFGVDTKLVPGGRGEFSVWLDGVCVAAKTGDTYPPGYKIIAAIHKLRGTASD